MEDDLTDFRRGEPIPVTEFVEERVMPPAERIRDAGWGRLRGGPLGEPVDHLLLHQRVWGGRHRFRGPGMDAIIHSLSGIIPTSGGPEDPPVPVGVPMADALTPVWAVVGILAALYRRQRSETGGAHRCVGAGVLTSLVASEDGAALAELGQPMRTGPALPRLAPFGLYRRTDGWIAPVAPQDKLVAALFAAMSRPELQEEPAFATRDARVSHDAAPSVEVEQQPAVAVVEALEGPSGSAHRSVRSPTEAVVDRRVVARREPDQLEL